MDLLDLLAQTEPTTDVVHAIRPNMWAACGWCSCGCQGNPGDTYVLREHTTTGVTCPACITEMTQRPWNRATPTATQEVAS